MEGITKINKKEEIPKILWLFWVNFNKKDNIINNKVNVNDIDKNLNSISDCKIKFFINFIRKSHNKETGWTVNVITNKSILNYWISQMTTDGNEDKDFITQIMNHQYIKPAHKSDCMRYLLLKYFGGIWVDTTTFVFSDLSKLIENKTFVVPYMNIYQGINLFFGDPKNTIKSLNNKTETTFKLLKENIIELIELKTENMYIPENYFIASTKNNSIINNVILQLKQFWTNDTLKKIDAENYDKVLCDYMYLITYNKLFISSIWNFKPVDDTEFVKMWKDGAYLFNYIQLYNAINENNNKSISHNNTIKNNKGKLIANNKIKLIANNKSKIIKNNKIKLREIGIYNENFYKKECELNSEEFNSCVDIEISQSDNEILLISASYLRLFRKNNGTPEIYYEKLMNKYNYKAFIEVLLKNRQYFIKIS